MNRNCVEFKDKYNLKSLYCSSVRSIYERSTIIWPSYQLSHKSKSEKVLRKFLRFILFKCSMHVSIHEKPHSLYAPHLFIFNLKTLKRHVHLDLYFLYKLLT